MGEKRKIPKMGKSESVQDVSGSASLNRLASASEHDEEMAKAEVTCADEDPEFAERMKEQTFNNLVAQSWCK